MGNHFCSQKRSRYSWKLWSFLACICNSDQLKQRMLFYVVVVLWLAMLRYLNVLNFKSFCLNSNLNFPRFFFCLCFVPVFSILFFCCYLFVFLLRWEVSTPKKSAMDISVIGLFFKFVLMKDGSFRVFPRKCKHIFTLWRS